MIEETQSEGQKGLILFYESVTKKVPKHFLVTKCWYEDDEKASQK